MSSAWIIWIEMPSLILTLLVALGAMLLLWLLSLPLRNAAIVDVWWAPGMALLGAVAWWFGPSGERAMLIVVACTLWAARLGIYLGWRAWGKPEDRRYQAMRRKHGERFGMVSLGTVFMLQGTLQWIISMPVQLTALAPGEALGPLDAIGTTMFTIGLAFESIGDFQLARFKADPANEGRVMDRGLWRYTRHPNYFGDFLVWWGLYVIALSSPWGMWTLPAPLLMSFLLMRVSGVTLLEKTIGKRRPGYREYVARTSAFFPWPPRRSK